jgi:hypothetical protein
VLSEYSHLWLFFAVVMSVVLLRLHAIAASMHTAITIFFITPPLCHSEAGLDPAEES